MERRVGSLKQSVTETVNRPLFYYQGIYVQAFDQIAAPFQSVVSTSWLAPEDVLCDCL